MEKRKNYLIDTKFQTDFILKFCLLVVATGAFIMAALYAFAGKATTVSFVNSRVVVQSTADYIFPLLIQTLVVSVIVVGLATIVAALFISHRIAGPAYRFKSVLGTLGKGDFSRGCSIRSKDSLQDVSAALNDMIANVRTNLDLIDKDLKGLEGKLGAGDPIEIKRSVSELDKKLRNFKF